MSERKGKREREREKTREIERIHILTRVFNKIPKDEIPVMDAQ